MTYGSDKSDGPTAGTETADPLEFLAGALVQIPDKGHVTTCPTWHRAMRIVAFITPARRRPHPPVSLAPLTPRDHAGPFGVRGYATGTSGGSPTVVAMKQGEATTRVSRSMRAGESAGGSVGDNTPTWNVVAVSLFRRFPRVADTGHPRPALRTRSDPCSLEHFPDGDSWPRSG